MNAKNFHCRSSKLFVVPISYLLLTPFDKRVAYPVCFCYDIVNGSTTVVFIILYNFMWLCVAGEEVCYHAVFFELPMSPCLVKCNIRCVVNLPVCDVYIVRCFDLLTYVCLIVSFVYSACSPAYICYFCQTCFKGRPTTWVTVLTIQQPNEYSYPFPLSLSTSWQCAQACICKVTQWGDYSLTSNEQVYIYLNKMMRCWND